MQCKELFIPIEHTIYTHSVEIRDNMFTHDGDELKITETDQLLFYNENEVKGTEAECELTSSTKM